MRFLPVFLDLQAGPILLIGAGELARAKLRLLLAADARIRWHVTDGDRDLTGLGDTAAAAITFAEGDPLTADLSGVVAVMCAGAGEIAVLDLEKWTVVARWNAGPVPDGMALTR